MYLDSYIPREIKEVVISFLLKGPRVFQDLASVAKVSKSWNEAASGRQIWESIAKTIGCPFNKAEASNLRQRVLSFLSNLNESLKHLCAWKTTPLPFWEGIKPPEFIQEIANKSSLTIQNIQDSQRYLKTEDTIFVWKEIASGIQKETPDLSSLSNDPNALHQAFDIWCTQHQADLDKIIVLNLSQLGLTSLPPQITRLSKLVTLDLSENHLQSLPPEIGNIPSLIILNLSRNDLRVLPPEIGGLHNLTFLDVSENRLDALPPEMKNLTHLQSINLKDNSISSGNFLENQGEFT